MKKLLLATTFLAGSAGLAAAEVALSGSAEMGIWSNELGDIAFWQEVEVKFTMSGTTDGGLEFGAVVDLDEAELTRGDGSDDDGTTVYVKGAFGNLTMGDTDGALDWAVQDAGSLTSIADDHTTHIAYFNANAYDPGPGDGQIVRYDNTFGAIGFAISAEQGDDGIGAVDDIIGVGVKYTADLGGTALNLGLGYQDAGNNGSVIGVSAGAELAGGFSGMIGYLAYDNDAALRDTHLGVGLTYTTGALSVHANYGDLEDTAGVSVDSFGVAVNYDLGGGAAVQFGYGSDVDIDGVAGSGEQWSLGLGMSF
ncbi:porin [Rhodobacter sp. Har01]|uniref:porin n=1 Tax=Rhodobacter sp. Har01 TaxID=2883999 RepID=UPI001D06D042|nr:porin [Rhodobacter sp. Har01]MCB6177782.1 porin [Rhodobacter sp. Har01]